jgi:hypothetical protein
MVDIEREMRLMAMVLGIRDVAAYLLSTEAARSPDAESVYREVSEITAKRLHKIGSSYDLDLSTMAQQEAIQGQVDWIIAQARKISQDE